jgi:hypothetical protein
MHQGPFIIFHPSVTDAIRTWRFTGLLNEKLQTARTMQPFFPHAAINREVQPGFEDECLRAIFMVFSETRHAHKIVCLHNTFGCRKVKEKR